MRNGLKALFFCAVIAIVWSNTGVGAASPITRSFSAGRFALEIDGNVAGFVNAVEGGQAFGDVVYEQTEDIFFKKHLGNAGFRDIRLEFGPDMDKSFYNWISQALQGQPVRLNGAIVAADFAGNVTSRLEFLHALITEVTFPAADATSKDTAHMSIVLSPDQTILNRKASGKLSVKNSGPQKRWLSSSFRLSIDGLDTKRVSKIDALTIKLPRASAGDGSQACLHCDPLPASTKIDFPNLVVTTIEPADSFYEWFQKFVIEGNNDDAQEKGGTLEYLATDLKTVLFTVKLRNLGVFELMPVEDQGSGLPRLLAGMYCESMELVAP